MTDTNQIKTEEVDKQKEIPSCCAGEKREASSSSKSTFFANIKKKPSQTLIVLLAIAIFGNILVMGLFTYNVNKKLGEAIDMTKPQEGSLTLVLPPDCPMCGDLSSTAKNMKAQNIELTEDNVVYVDSDEGKSLVKEFKLEKLPALVFVSQEKIKMQLAQALKKGSRAVGENVLVWESALPPYLDIGSGTIAGLVSLTYLTDKSCSTCYDVRQTQRPILQRFGIAVVSENLVDISEAEGRRLLNTYSITAVPTVILSSEVGQYDALVSVWNQVGTIEDDGSFIFREMSAIGATYKDVKTGKILGGESS